MLRDNRRDRVPLCFLFQLTRDPIGFSATQKTVYARLIVLQRPIIEIRSIVQVTRIASGIEFNVEHALRDYPALSSASNARILDGVLQIENDARFHTWVTFVNQYRPPPKKI